MTIIACLKIARAYLLGLGVIWLLSGLFLVLSGDSHYLFNRPTLGNVIFFMAVHQYSTAKGWDKFFLWLLIILGSLLWAWVFTSLYPRGLPLTLWQVLAISLTSAVLAGGAHLLLKKGSYT